jgi:hypothetical protein
LDEEIKSLTSKKKETKANDSDGSGEKSVEISMNSGGMSNKYNKNNKKYEDD